MRIALVSPAGSNSRDAAFRSLISRHPSLNNYVDSVSGAFSSGLLILAALTPEEFAVQVIDENFDAIDYREPFDIVGISAMTQQATRAYEIADKFMSTGATVAIGGIHATVLPEEAKRHCHSVFIGEAEETWPRFLEDFSRGDTQPFYRGRTGLDLESSPIPRYDLLRARDYKTVWLQTSRGCPHDCEFCAASRVYGGKFRHKSLERISEELDRICELWNEPNINFSDDNLFVDRNFSRALVRRLRESRVRWFAQSDISIAKDKAFLEEIRDAGCGTLFIGFESLSPDALKEINNSSWKLRQLPNYAKAIETIQSTGIGVVGAFIIGFDSDTPETFELLTDFVISNNIFMPQISILTPLPGTRIYDRFRREGRLLGRDWSNFTYTEVNFSPKNMSPTTLQDALMEIYETVYSYNVRKKVLQHFKAIYRRRITDLPDLT